MYIFGDRNMIENNFGNLVRFLGYIDNFKFVNFFLVKINIDSDFC